MAFGTIPLGSAAIIMVGSSAPPTTQVGGLNAYTATQDRPTTTRKYFMQTAQVFVGESTDTFELSGDYSVGDSGQDFIRGAYDAGDIFYIEILPDGTNGFSQPVRCSHAELRGPSPDDPPATTFQFGATDVRTDIGAGL
jgi:hypothetical protein